VGLQINKSKTNVMSNDKLSHWWNDKIRKQYCHTRVSSYDAHPVTSTVSKADEYERCTVSRLNHRTLGSSPVVHWSPSWSASNSPVLKVVGRLATLLGSQAEKRRFSMHRMSF